MKKLLIIIQLLIIAHFISAQKVNDKSYQKRLDSLLSERVEQVSVSSINLNNTNLIFLDAREQEEYAVSHIKNSVWIGYNDVNKKTIRQRLKGINKDQRIIVYCSVGYRSEKIALALEKAGYSNVANLFGSIFEWVNQGRPVYDKYGRITKKVHAFNKKWGRWLRKGEKVY